MSGIPYVNLSLPVNFVWEENKEFDPEENPAENPIHKPDAIVAERNETDDNEESQENEGEKENHRSQVEASI